MSSIAQPTDPNRFSIAEVVRLAAKGDEGAWRDLVDRFDRLVMGSVRRIGGLSNEDYEDAAATTWLRFVDEVHRLRNPKAVGAWLGTTAYREALRIARKRRPSVDLDEAVLGQRIGVEPDLGENLLCDQIRATVVAAMDSLSPTGRRLLEAMLDDPDASYKEIEVNYGIMVGSIGPIRKRVLNTLSAALAQIGVATPDAGVSRETVTGVRS